MTITIKKHPSKLDDLVQAARAEAPVVSFEESARHIASLAEKRRKPLWMWLADAWAFPLQKLQSLRSPNVAWLPQQSVFARNAIVRGAFVRGFAGACAVMLVLGIFPSLVHDMRFEQLRFVQSTRSHNIGTGNAPKQHSGPFLSAGASISTEQTNSVISAIGARTDAGFKASKSQELTHANIPPDGSTPTPQSAVFPKNALALSADTVARNTDTIHANAAIVFAPENSIISALRQTTPQSSGTLPNGSSQQSSLVVKSQPAPPQSLLMREKSTIAAEESTHQTLPPDAVQEPIFWQRVTLEARLAARTDLASPMQSTLLAATESQASTPLQNLALGVYYALSEHHSLGVEGGNEPFLTAVRFNSTGSLTAMTDTTNRGFNTSLAPNTKPADGVLPARADQYRQGSTNRTWFGAAYQYNADVWDALGGVQPLARITLGGGELGAVGRTLVGARFMAKERFSILFAGEGAAVASQIQGSWNLTPRLGVTLGLSVKL